MRKVTITYNPYRVKTSIEVDGESIQNNSKLSERCFNERLQNWIDKFLVGLHDEYQDKNIVIDFKGTDLDAEDLQNAVKDYNEENP